MSVLSFALLIWSLILLWGAGLAWHLDGYDFPRTWNSDLSPLGKGTWKRDACTSDESEGTDMEKLFSLLHCISTLYWIGTLAMHGACMSIVSCITKVSERMYHHHLLHLYLFLNCIT